MKLHNLITARTRSKIPFIRSPSIAYTTITLVMLAHISIFVLKFGLIFTNILETENNFVKPKLEHTNVVNKGVWTRNKFKDNSYDKEIAREFLFRPNSLDVDNLLQNNFDAFGTNYMQDIPFFSSYVDRAKRSTNHKRKRHSKKSMKYCKNKMDCGKLVSKDDNVEFVGSKLTLDLKSSSANNNYAYEVDIVPQDNNNVNDRNNIETNAIDNNAEYFTLNEPLPKEFNEKNNNVTRSANSATQNVEEDIVRADGDLKNAIGKKEIHNNAESDTKYNMTIAKRKKKNNIYNDDVKKIEFIEDLNKTDAKFPVYKTEKEIFDREKSWNGNAYSQDVNIYKVVPKTDVNTERSKPVTERGLIKVISMLTKTFKKVMKHHNEIKDINEKLTNLNEDFTKNIAMVNDRIQNFDEKYMQLIKFDDKLKKLDNIYKTKEDYFKKMEPEISKYFLDFKNQQTNFLNQQKQFYAIQKLMLTQNEKINIKQNLIAKTQSEISHRQNNFARILKKAKQLYLESKNPGTKLNINIAKPKDYDIQKPVTTTPKPVTESIKINLFSIPVTTNKLEFKDDVIIKDKEEQPIDDLVYKYYFNNTFIDNLMKSKILTGVIATADQINPKPKNKRNGLETTLLLPIKEKTDSKRVRRSLSVTNNDEKTEITHLESKLTTQSMSDDISLSKLLITDTAIVEGSENQSTTHSVDISKDTGVSNVPLDTPKRRKRWINHASQKHHKQHHEKSYYLRKNRENHKKINFVISKPHFKMNATDAERNSTGDPFLNMATKFCVEIGQNVTEQALSWCVEKALRRLKVMDTRKFAIPPSVNIEKPVKVEKDATTRRTDTTTMESAKTSDDLTRLKTTESPMTEITLPLTIITEASYLSPFYQVENQNGPNTFFPDNEELESNLKDFELTPDPEGTFYYEGSLHASDIVAGPDSDGSDVLTGLDSNSRMDVDPYALYLQAMRRASVRRINEDILKKIKIH